MTAMKSLAATMRLAAGTGFAVTIAAVVLVAGAPASATPPVLLPPAPASSGSPAPGGGIFTGLNRKSQLFGDLFGIRKELSKHGITLDASETSEVLGNVTGGIKQGATYDGLLQAALQLDTQRAFGYYGGTFNVSALQIHGSNLSANNLDSLQTASGIEADRATRLWELWYQQQLISEDKLDVKIGQQSLDQEFIVNQNSLMFVNTMFGWPMLPSADLPGGGPAYPLSALGVRLRARPNNSFTVLAGVFNGSPDARNAGGDPQLLDHAGTVFPLDGGVLAIGEVQYTSPALGGIVYADKPEPLARTIKLGMWYDSENFADQALDTNGVPLVSPLSNGLPRQHQGNYSAYATIDQLLAQDAKDPFKTVSAFARVMGSPLGAENLIAFSADAGVVIREPVRHRRDDTLGFGMGYTHVGSGASDSDQYAAQFVNPLTPVRSSETFVEATYQYTVYPWLQLQPDLQFVMNPGAGLLDPANPTRRLGNETVIGLRTIIQL
jgi:porin